jgi:hemerythrin
MPLVYWNEGLSVEVKSMDDQHKKLIEMINDFYENIVNRTNRENISKLLVEMKDYILEHFSAEENYMKKFEYDYYKEHKKEHDKFVEKVTEVEKRYNKGELILSLDMTMFLIDWLKNHIQKSDKKYSDFFIRHGIQ